MAAIELESLPDDELQQLYDNAGQLLAGRKRERQQSLLEEVRAKLAGEGLSLRDLTRLAKRTPRTKTAVQGKTFTNPADPTQTWTPGRGRPPKWAKSLQK